VERLRVAFGGVAATPIRAGAWETLAVGEPWNGETLNRLLEAARGLGTPKSMSDAYKWFALAAAQGDKEAARKRDDVATQLDAAALGQAQAAVKDFTATPQPQEAIAVAAPAGGWDEASPAHPTPLSKGRSGGAPAGSYKVGNR